MKDRSEMTEPEETAIAGDNEQGAPMPVPAAPERPHLVSVDLFRLYLDEIKRYPLLSREEERDLAIRYREKDDLNAGYRLITANLRLVVKIAMDFQRYWMQNLMDLIQEGNVGLMQAVKKFDRTIRIPSNILRELSQIAAAEEGLLQEFGRPPLPEEVALRLGVPAARVRALRKMSQQMLSLQSTARADSDTELIDFVADIEEHAPEFQTAQKLLRESIGEALDTLEEREREVLALRFGLEDDEPQTFESIGRRFHLSSERIRQIEFKALKKLRHPTRQRFFDGYS